MVPVAKTIIDKSAVMVESLHTLVAVVAMASVLRFQVLAENTDIVKVKFLLNQSFH